MALNSLIFIKSVLAASVIDGKRIDDIFSRLLLVLTLVILSIFSHALLFALHLITLLVTDQKELMDHVVDLGVLL